MMTYKDAFYIGSRSCKCLPEHDIHYHSSSELIKHLKTHGIEFTKTVVGIFDTRNEAHKIEHATIKQVITQKQCMNLAADGFFLKDADRIRKIDYLALLFKVSLNGWVISAKSRAHNKPQKERKKQRKKFKQREALRLPKGTTNDN